MIDSVKVPFLDLRLREDGAAVQDAIARVTARGWYVLGRTAGWSIEVLFVYAALAFPYGRLADRADRALVAAMALVVVTLAFSTGPALSGSFIPRQSLA